MSSFSSMGTDFTEVGYSPNLKGGMGALSVAAVGLVMVGTGTWEGLVVVGAPNMVLVGMVVVPPNMVVVGMVVGTPNMVVVVGAPNMVVVGMVAVGAPNMVVVGTVAVGMVVVGAVVVGIPNTVGKGWSNLGSVDITGFSRSKSPTGMVLGSTLVGN